MVSSQYEVYFWSEYLGYPWLYSVLGFIEITVAVEEMSIDCITKNFKWSKGYNLVKIIVWEYNPAIVAGYKLKVSV